MRALRSRARQRGAAALEFALVAPVILLMILGMIDFSMVMNAQAVIANAARDGARKASLGYSEQQSKQEASQSSEGLTNWASVDTSKPNPTVTVQCYKDVSSTTPDCTGSNYDAQLADKSRPATSIVKVTVTYQYTFITPIASWLGLGSQITIPKVSYMRIETPPS